MISDPLARFSIKERLRSNNHSPSAGRVSQPQSPQKRQVLAPEHYNYFLNTMEKELKHQSNTFRKIKRTIEEYKLNKAGKNKIKNAYEYNHQMFPSKTKKNHLAKGRPKFSSTAPIPFQQITNTQSKQQVSYANMYVKSRFSRKGLSSAKSTTFVRTPQHTFYDSMEPCISKQLKHQQSTGFRKVRVQGEGLFEVMGSKPKWGVFESYRTHYNRSFKSPI